MCLTSDAFGLGCVVAGSGDGVFAGEAAGAVVSTAAGAGSLEGAGEATGALTGGRGLTREGAAAGAGAGVRAASMRWATAASTAGDGLEPAAEARIAAVANTETTASAASCGRVKRRSLRAAAPRPGRARSRRAAAPRPCGRGCRAQVVADRHLVVEAAEIGLHEGEALDQAVAARRELLACLGARSWDHDRVGQLALLVDVGLALRGLDLLDDLGAVGLLLGGRVLADHRVPAAIFAALSARRPGCRP